MCLHVKRVQPSHIIHNAPLHINIYEDENLVIYALLSVPVLHLNCAHSAVPAAISFNGQCVRASSQITRPASMCRRAIRISESVTEANLRAAIARECNNSGAMHSWDTFDRILSRKLASIPLSHGMRSLCLAYESSPPNVLCTECCLAQCVWCILCVRSALGIFKCNIIAQWQG